MFLQKNKNFKSNEYVEKYNMKKKRDLNILIFITLITNIILFNINEVKRGNLKEINKDNNPTEVLNGKPNNIENNEAIVNNINFISKVISETRVFDFSLIDNNIYFKLFDVYDDNFILELTKEKEFDIESINYNELDNYIEIKGRLI